MSICVYNCTVCYILKMFFNKENIVMYFVHNKQMIVGIRKKKCSLFDRLIVNLDVYIWNEMAVKIVSNWI